MNLVSIGFLGTTWIPNHNIVVRPTAASVTCDAREQTTSLVFVHPAQLDRALGLACAARGGVPPIIFRVIVATRVRERVLVDDRFDCVAFFQI